MDRPLISRKLAAIGLMLFGLSANAQETVWFVVAEHPDEATNFDSFLLPLSRPADIATARSIIEQGTRGQGVAAVVAPGGDGFNRDVRARDGSTPAWSWHVSEFDSFFEVSIQDCSASPTGIELGKTAAQDNGCRVFEFGPYTVVEELDDAPKFRISEGLSGAWHNREIWGQAGQGLFIDVFPERGEVLLAWLTYGDGGPTGRPDDEHVWVTALGSFTDNIASLDAFASAGGRFNRAAAVTNRKIGQIELEFSDCDHGTLHFSFDDGQSGEFPIRRTASRPGCVSRIGDRRAREAQQ